MANTFTKTGAFRFGGAAQKSILIVEGTFVVDTAGGDTAGDLPASLFGLATIKGISTFIKSDDSKSYFGTPSTAGTSIMIGGGAANAVMDIPTGTYNAVVQGFSL